MTVEWKEIKSHAFLAGVNFSNVLASELILLKEWKN